MSIRYEKTATDKLVIAQQTGVALDELLVGRTEVAERLGKSERQFRGILSGETTINSAYNIGAYDRDTQQIVDPPRGKWPRSLQPWTVTSSASVGVDRFYDSLKSLRQDAGRVGGRKSKRGTVAGTIRTSE